ncbi:Rieske 2Fe-2S domain-containing protein [Ramlibacter sp. USB13]|uniref:Rieske 2Fe-2S domain-containing protein n=1 Tax=Ramlibacter cellulosilyticus TaxID=2764187 RepID=A0A923SCU7_9BURK|nr:SRPBCC family protein [Ramlibacter cellulosilyticus]MBC5784648.1 Rieske 2Fe-2S domain-containing protein [Ramlibacter cellulosilyticus]
MPLPPVIDDRPAEGIFRVHRDVFRDAALFEREMRTFFAGHWVFVGHASQVPAPHDYLTLRLAGQPLVLMRDGAGRLHCVHNSCRHKGAMVVHHRRGNRRTHVCAYHGWSYGSNGANIAIKAEAQGGYTAAFGAECHDLVPVARFAEYRGFLFASLSADVPPLEEYLGDARVFIDMAVDQAEQGLELVPGSVTYSYQGNWKLQLENSTDAYHFTSTHPSYLRLLERRARMPGRADVEKAIWQAEKKQEETMGSFGFPNGHALVWTTTPQQNHPLFPQLPQLRSRVGDTRADWMLRTRQLNIFPNLQIASNAALQMRVITPLAVDRTEITSYCLAPVGESPERRRQRLRQYEDFFNPSGLATPDDTVTYEDCQRGFASGDIEWQQGYMRGMQRVVRGADAHAAELGITPDTSVSGSFEMSDETVFHALYRHWASRMEAAA